MNKNISRQQEILEVSSKLFAQHWYKWTSVSMIAEAVGIKKPSLYYFFKNKLEIYTTLLFDTMKVTKEAFSDTHKELEEVILEVLLIASDRGVSVYSMNNSEMESIEWFWIVAQDLWKTMFSYLSRQKLRCSTKEAFSIILWISQSYWQDVAQGKGVISPKKYANTLSTLLQKNE